MAFKNIISTIITTFLWPNKGTIISPPPPSPPVCRNADVSGNECAVCLSSLKGGDETGTRVLPCRHEFHVMCVERWLAVPCFKNTCPVCRFLVEEDRDQSRRLECNFLTEEMVIWFSSFHVAGF